MLLDIEKFVQQILPPNRRKDNHIGILTTLFRADYVIEKQNSFEYDLQFDLGTAGQVGVLEHVLQSYIHEGITILDADGVRVDFRVLVPDVVSIAERGEAIRLVERYRLSSKRYEVVDVINWSNQGSDPVTGLDFSGTPNINDTYFLFYGINKSGVYFTNIRNLDTGEVFRNQDLEYTAHSQMGWQLPGAGRWRIQVGSIFRIVNRVNVEYVTYAPDWLSWIGYTFDVNSREGTIYIDASIDCKLKIKRKELSISR